ncbi:hypothetical protein [Candidatus Endomicrobiellum trichonymphae]|nr:hypothetical protein [Candidatus Endomicrobium trichonymphae]
MGIQWKIAMRIDGAIIAIKKTVLYNLLLTAADAVLKCSEAGA